jgi:hypothetical protein
MPSGNPSATGGVGTIGSADVVSSWTTGAKSAGTKVPKSHAMFRVVSTTAAGGMAAVTSAAVAVELVTSETLFSEAGFDLPDAVFTPD